MWALIGRALEIITLNECRFPHVSGGGLQLAGPGALSLFGEESGRDGGI